MPHVEGAAANVVYTGAPQIGLGYTINPPPNEFPSIADTLSYRPGLPTGRLPLARDPRRTDNSQRRSEIRI